MGRLWLAIQNQLHYWLARMKLHTAIDSQYLNISHIKKNYFFFRILKNSCQLNSIALPTIIERKIFYIQKADFVVLSLTGCIKIPLKKMVWLWLATQAHLHCRLPRMKLQTAIDNQYLNISRIKNFILRKLKNSCQFNLTALPTIIERKRILFKVPISLFYHLPAVLKFLFITKKKLLTCGWQLKLICIVGCQEWNYKRHLKSII